MLCHREQRRLNHSGGEGLKEILTCVYWEDLRELLKILAIEQPFRNISWQTPETISIFKMPSSLARVISSLIAGRIP